MAGGGRTEVSSDVKFGAGASFIELYLWSKFGDPAYLKTVLRYTGERSEQ